MVEARYNCYVLGLVLIFLALTGFVAHTHRANEEMVIVGRGGKAFLAAGLLSPSNLEKENSDVAPSAAGANSSGKLGGRKMMEKVMMGKKMEKQEEAINGLATKNSGRSMNVPKNPLEVSDDRASYQMVASMFKPNPLGSDYLGTYSKGSVDDLLYRTNRIEEADTIRGRSVVFSKSMPLVSKGSSDFFQKFQSQKLLVEATTTGIVNLMNKDYSGSGGSGDNANPPRRPPINNFEPLVHENKAP